MPTPVVKAVCVFPHLSGLPKDTDEVTFAFVSEDADGTTLAGHLETAQVLQHFWNSANTSHPIAWYLSSILDRTAGVARVDYYDVTAHLDGSAAGPPVVSAPFTLGAGDAGSFNLPAEDAAVITLYGANRHAAPVTGPVSSIPTPHRAQVEGAPPTHSGRTRPKQSRTGRLYIGPLRTNALGYILEETYLKDTFVADLGVASGRLVSETEAISTGSPTWGVWSRKLGNVDTIVGGRIDNAVDTQRRRGVESTTRLAWS